MTWLIAAQWPGFVFGMLGALMVTSQSHKSRMWGFILWVLSDICFIAYGSAIQGWGLVALQAYFVLTSSFGAWNNRK